MYVVYRIPLEPTPQRFDIELGGRALTMEVRWNPEIPGWILDIYDADTDAPLILCLPLITGIDMLAQHRYLGLPGSIVVTTDGDDLAVPTEYNLGGDSNLFHVIDQ